MDLHTSRYGRWHGLSDDRHHTERYYDKPLGQKQLDAMPARCRSTRLNVVIAVVAQIRKEASTQASGLAIGDCHDEYQ